VTDIIEIGIIHVESKRTEDKEDEKHRALEDAKLLRK